MAFPAFLRKRLSKFRRPRKYAKRYLGTRRGLSLLQIGSRIRTNPPWKRRKFDAMSSQNDEDPSVSLNRPQTGELAGTAPLSSVRFKDPSSTVFDYHHFCTRIRCAAVTVPAEAKDHYTSQMYRFTFSGLPDSADLSQSYSRYRITRIVMEFCPVFNNIPTTLGSTYRQGVVYGRIYRGLTFVTSTEQQMLSVQDATHWMTYEPHSVSWTPNAIEANEEEEAKTETGETPVLAPWIPMSKQTVYHYGYEIGVTNLSTNDTATDVYAVYATVYYDCDGQSF